MEQLRHYKGALGILAKVLLIALPTIGIIYVLDIPVSLGLKLYGGQYMAFFLGLLLCLIFLMTPPSKGAAKDKLPWYDGILALLGLTSGLYLFVFYDSIYWSMGNPTILTLVLGSIAIILSLEGCRRFYGWVIPMIAIVFIIYCAFAESMPGVFMGASHTWEHIVEGLYYYPGGILGIAIKVAATILVAFLFFGRMILASGGGEVITNATMSTVGRFRGGGAKVSVVSSSLFGVISGSAAANVATTGIITIPLMKRVGYKPHVAGAIEAVSSTGGQIMPPVMGAAAFIMAEFLEIPYVKVIIAAAIPAILYYVCVFIQVDLEAAKTGLKGLPQDQLPPLRLALRDSYIVLLPLLLLIFLLIGLRYDASLSALYAIGLLVLLSLFKKTTRLGPKKILNALVGTSEVLLLIGSVCTVAGIVIGVISFTGLGPSVSSALVSAAGGIPLALLMLAALTSIILGMGMSVTPCYILVAILVAPALIQVGIIPLAAHLFVFYFGVLSFLTPPICMAVYIAAGMAQSEPMRTAMRAIFLGIAAYVVPFAFAFRPEIIMSGGAVEIIIAFAMCLIAVAFLAVGIEGYLFRKLNWWKGALLIGAGIAVLAPGLVNEITGIIVGICLVLWEGSRSRSSRPVVTAQSEHSGKGIK